MRIRRLVLAGLVLAITVSPAVADIGIGDNVPRLEVKEFVKGEAVKEIAKGKIYVVEFWATWCGPCIQSIPHVSDLQKKHKEVTFIGVSVWERDQSLIKPFVEKMGEKMDYRVAMDTAEGAMAKNWMTAAGQDGIPAAFIINGEGKIAWIGHPMQMDKPLADIVAGKWDIQVAAKEFKDKAAAAKKMAALRTKIQEAQKSGDLSAVVKLLDDAVAEDASMEKTVANLKFTTLQKLGDASKTLSYGQHLVEKVFKDEQNQLNFIAWNLVEPASKGTKTDAKLLKLALQAAQRADELVQSKDAAVADTLALAYFQNGEKAKALETQERAMKLAKGSQLENDEGMKARLEQFKKAVKE